MADSSVAVTPGTGANVDTRTTTTGEHRQVVVLGDPDTDAATASVVDISTINGAAAEVATNPLSGDALNVNINAVQLATYKFIVKPGAAAVSTNTIAYRAALWHLGTSLRTVRIRAIEANVAVGATAQSLSAEVHRIGAAPTAGTAVSGATTGTATVSLIPMDPRDAACEAQGSYGSVTGTSTGITASAFIAASSTAALHGGGTKIYDWQEGGPQKPITFPAGTFSGIMVGLISSAAPTLTPTLEITFTEV